MKEGHVGKKEFFVKILPSSHGRGGMARGTVCSRDRYLWDNEADVWGALPMMACKWEGRERGWRGMEGGKNIDEGIAAKRGAYLLSAPGDEKSRKFNGEGER